MVFEVPEGGLGWAPTRAPKASKTKVFQVEFVLIRAGSETLVCEGARKGVLGGTPFKNQVLQGGAGSELCEAQEFPLISFPSPGSNPFVVVRLCAGARAPLACELVRWGGGAPCLHSAGAPPARVLAGWGGGTPCLRSGAVASLACIDL